MLPIGSLPSPSDPAFIAIGALIGGFVGESLARTRGYNADKKMRTTVDASYYGTGFGLVGYLLANFAEAVVL